MQEVPHLNQDVFFRQHLYVGIFAKKEEKPS
jgi:hypothetical protein